MTRITRRDFMYDTAWLAAAAASESERQQQHQRKNESAHRYELSLQAWRSMVTRSWRTHADS